MKCVFAIRKKMMMANPNKEEDDDGQQPTIKIQFVPNKLFMEYVVFC